MKKKISIILVVLITIFIFLYTIYQDKLPPRTPHKVARLISNLSIPNSSKVLEFQDQWNEFNGNGFSFIVLQLDNRSFDNLYQEAKAKGYAKLPVAKNINVPLKDVFKEKTVGIYKIDVKDKTSMSFNGTILYSDDKRILVYVSVN